MRVNPGGIKKVLKMYPTRVNLGEINMERYGGVGLRTRWPHQTLRLPDFSEGDPVEIWAAAAKATAWLSSSEEAWLNARALVLHLLQATGTSYLVSLRVVAAFSTTELVRIVNPGDQDFTSLMEHNIKKHWRKGGSRSRRRDRPRSLVVLGV